MPPKTKSKPSLVDFNELSDRVDELEHLLKIKDDEVTSLKTVTDSISEKVRQQDELIENLRSRIEHDPIPENSVTPTHDEIPKTEHDLLVIGDSIVRDADPAVINPGGETTIKCLPGARPDDVVKEFRALSSTESFKRIIVHVGTNLIPSYSPDAAADKIVQCMEAIRELAPKSKIAYSHILPKFSDAYLPGINIINRRVSISGEMGSSRTRFGFTTHNQEFCRELGRVNPLLFKKDGIHLSVPGIKCFNNSLKSLCLIE